MFNYSAGETYKADVATIQVRGVFDRGQMTLQPWQGINR